jgi:transposase
MLSFSSFFFSRRKTNYFLSNMHYVIGIDMSKRSFHAAFDESSVRVFENSPEGIGSFLTYLFSHGATKEDVVIGVEATGAYHLLFCSQCVRMGLQVRVINPLEAWHVMRAASLRMVKTDRADALAIRRMVAQGIGRPYVDSEGTLALKTLVVDREGLVRMRAMMKQRREARIAKQQALTTRLSHFPKIEDALTKEICAIERQFGQHEPETQALLRSIPGIGRLTAAAIIAYVGAIERFASPEKLVAYIGLDSRVKESGTSVNGKGYMTKRGNRQLRHMLFNAAFIARQKNPELKTYFEKKLGEGKHYFSAMCAVERKLVHVIYAVWKRGTPFEFEHATRVKQLSSL